MTYDYFYGEQADQFSFFRIPKALFTEDHFKSVSAEAKVLYGILLDRMSLSRKNGWQDADSRVYIIYTVEEVMEALGCASQKASKLLAELENSAGLIERKRQGLGKPNLLYVSRMPSLVPCRNSRRLHNLRLKTRCRSQGRCKYLHKGKCQPVSTQSTICAMPDRSEAKP